MKIRGMKVRRLVMIPTVFVAGMIPVALYASGWMQMNFSGQSCISRATPLMYDDDGAANSSAAALEIQCPIVTSSGVIGGSVHLAPDQALQNFDVIYVNPGGSGVWCIGNVVEYFKQANGDASTSPTGPTGNHWQTSTFTGRSPSPAYLSLMMPLESGKLIAGGDAQQASLHCSLPAKVAQGKSKIYAYTVAYSQ